MNKEKTVAVGVRLPVELLVRVDRIVEKSRKETGFEVNRSDVIRKLVQTGLPKMEKR